MACAAGRALRLVRRRLRSPVGAHARAAIRREHIGGDRHGERRSCWGSPAAAPSWPGARCACVRPLRLLALLEARDRLVCAAAAVGRAPHHPAGRCGRRPSVARHGGTRSRRWPRCCCWRCRPPRWVPDSRCCSRAGDAIERNIGTAYGSNTLGAAAGALLPLLLLPSRRLEHWRYAPSRFWG